MADDFEDTMGEPQLTEAEYRVRMDKADREEALYDAREYLVAGLANQSEWWEHLGDAHRDYAALARAAEALVIQLAEAKEQTYCQVCGRALDAADSGEAGT